MKLNFMAVFFIFGAFKSQLVFVESIKEGGFLELSRT